MSNDPDAVNEASEMSDEQPPARPHIEVTKGSPTDEDLAALIAVLSGATGGDAPDPGPRERNMWGHPVDKLSYPIFSWQRVMLLEREHLRR